jgi:hypothetical protein
MVTQAQIEAYVEEMQQATECTDDWPERWEPMRKRLAHRSPHPGHLETELRRAYEEATGMRLGCE